MNESVKFFLKKGYLVSPDFLSRLKNIDKNSFLDLLDKKIKNKKNLVLLNNDLSLNILNSKNNLDISWLEFDNSKVLSEKNKDDEIYNTFLDMLGYHFDEGKKEEINQILGEVKKEESVEIIEEDKTDEGNVVILKSYNEDSRKRDIQDFVTYFRNRYDFLKGILANRQELQNVISINRLLNRDKGDKGNVSLIGTVYDKAISKNGNIILKLEDKTGIISLIVTKNNQEVFNMVSNVVLDEVIGISGFFGDKVVFVNHLYFPDVPLTKELKKSNDDAYCVFTSDMHMGEDLFLEENFNKFINWLNGKDCSEEEKEIIKKIKYLFIVGDVVAGVGIYPGQESDLLIKDIYKQYEKFVSYIKRIPKRIKIIICAGNHDALRIAEPQPRLEKEHVPELCGVDNIYLITNPSLVNIHSSENFNGFDVLVYHGYSFPFFADTVDSIRLEGGMTRADLIMKFLLQKRHLAPTHTSNLYIPDVHEDPLLIDKVPDFFVTGHIHRVNCVDYRNVTCLNCGCWVSQSNDQKKRGIVPDPCKIFLVNLQTRKVEIKDFNENE